METVHFKDFYEKLQDIRIELRKHLGNNFYL